jgi:hypothetical protein
MVRLSILPVSQNPGCTDVQAINYELSAFIDDGSCDYPGCTNEDADNFDSDSNYDDGSCVVGGCIDSTAFNFNPFATYQSTDCIYRGCTAPIALNYNPQANEDDGTCEFLSAQITAPSLSGCPPFLLRVNNNNEFNAEGLCSYTIDGVEVYNVCSSQFEYTLNEPGFYELTYSISIGNAIADTTVFVEVFETTDQPILTYAPDTHVLTCANCTDENLTWYFDGAVVAQGASTSFDTEIDGITQNGVYQLNTTNTLGCSTLSEVISIVQPHLSVSIDQGCAPLTVYFNNLTDTITGLTCSLNTGLSIIDDFTGQVEVVYTDASSYSPSLSCSASSASGSVVTSIIVSNQELPILIVDEGSQSVVCQNASAFAQFTWNIDGTITSGGSSQPLGGDVYQLQAYNADGCGGSNLLIVNNTREHASADFAVYPNPAHSYIQISNAASGSYRILNSLAQIVWEGSKNNSASVVETINWPSGLYYVLWTEAGIARTTKIEIVH